MAALHSYVCICLLVALNRLNPVCLLYDTFVTFTKSTINKICTNILLWRSPTSDASDTPRMGGNYRVCYSANGTFGLLQADITCGAPS
jgi:hypothetical protein